MNRLKHLPEMIMITMIMPFLFLAEWIENGWGEAVHLLLMYKDLIITYIKDD